MSKVNALLPNFCLQKSSKVCFINKNFRIPIEKALCDHMNDAPAPRFNFNPSMDM